MTTHAVWHALKMGEQDSVCVHDAPGRWTDILDEVTCPECLNVLRERGIA